MKKKIKVVKSGAELLRNFRNDGYIAFYEGEGKIGYIIEDFDEPDFPNEMFQYCNKEPAPGYIWRPNWLTTKEVEE